MTGTLAAKICRREQLPACQSCFMLLPRDDKTITARGIECAAQFTEERRQPAFVPVEVPACTSAHLQPVQAQKQLP